MNANESTNSIPHGAAPVLAIHGGAWDWPDELDEPKLTGIAAALTAGHEVLIAGGSAVDAVERSVRVLEGDPVFDAGYGGYLNRDGVVQLDALVIDGSTGDFGAVAGVTTASNPVSVARFVMEELPECFYVGAGADAVAEACGLADVVGDSLVTPAMRQYFEDQRSDGPRDTVGAVALDAAGGLASATSTSGTPYKPAGRVGDSAIFGAGGYAAPGVAAVGSTGHGEQIYRTLLAKFAGDCVALGMAAAEAAAAAADHFEASFPSSMSGVIIIDHGGNVGFSQTAPKMAHGWIDREGRIHTSVV